MRSRDRDPETDWNALTLHPRGMVLRMERSIGMTTLTKMAAGMLAVVLLFSCSKSKDKIIVAKINDRVITLERFENSYKNVDAKYLPPEGGFAGRRAFLETMINKEVMGIEADKLGYDKDPSVVQGMEAFKQLGLQAAYLKFRVADKIKITDKDIREYYDKDGVTLSVKQILVDTIEEADSIYQLLQNGADFETICKRYSKSPDASTGGRVLTVTYGGFTPEFQKEIFDLPIGGICHPIDTPYGYFIIKVLKKEKKEHPRPFEQERDRMEKMARSYKQMELTNQLSQQMFDKAGMQWNYEGLRIAFEALPPDRPLTNPPARSSEVYPLLHFTPEELKTPIVSYRDKTFTVQDFSDRYDKMSFFERPRRDYRWGGIKRVFTLEILNELVADEMEASNIENEPEVFETMKRKQEEMMVNQLYEDQIFGDIQLTEEDLRTYYDNNKEYFKVPEKRSFGVVLTSDREKALEAYDKIIHGERFPSVVQAYSIDEETKAQDGRTKLMIKGEQPEFDEVGFALVNVGDVAEPFQSSKGWVVLKLLELQKERQLSYEEAQSSIRSALQTIKAEERLQQKLAEWKKGMDIVVYENNLRKADVEDRVGTAAEHAE
jgi:parvulin-like peptidyl-prolyl isomerase